MVSFRHLIPGLVLLLVLASPSWGQEGETNGTTPLVIHAIRFRGNRTLPTKDLVKELVTPRPPRFRWKAPPIFRPEDLAEDGERLTAAYRRAGFYHAEITPEVHTELGTVTITFQIQEGPWLGIDHLEISVVGAPEMEAALRQFFLNGPMARGERFTEKKFDALKKEIIGFLMDRGYPKARVEGEVLVDLAKNTAGIYLQVWPGPFARFGPIRVLGQQDTPEALIRRALQFRPGEPFSLAKMIASQERLYETDLFRSINITPEEVPAEETEIPITVEVSERKNRSMRLGVGYGTWEQFRTRAIFRYRNLGGGGRVLETSAKYSRLDMRAEGSFLNPMLFGTQLDFVVNSGFLRRNYPTFSDRAFYSRTLLEKEVAPRTRVYLGHGLEFARPFGVTDLALQLLRETQSGKLYTVNMLLWGLTRDTVDNPADPQAGGQFYLLGEVAPNPLSPHVQFVQSSIEARRYQRLGLKRVVLAGRVKFGLTPPIQGTDQIPIFRRFFAGGPGSMRAYRLYYLGPRDLAGNPLGGESVFLTNLELRFPLVGDFGGVTFLDAGNVFYRLKNTDLGQLKYGAGCGVRYQTPIGPIGVELALPLNPINRQRDTYQVLFNIGHSF